MAITTRRIGLYCDVHGFVGFTQSSNHLSGVCIGRIGLEKTSFSAFQGLLGANKPFRRHHCRHQSTHRGITHVKRLVPGPINEKLHRTCCLAPAEPECADDLIGRQSQNTASRSRSTKHTTGCRRVKTPVVVFCGIQCNAETDLNFVTCHNARDNSLTIDPGHLCCCQCCRDDRCTGVDRTPRMGVIKIE